MNIIIIKQLMYFSIFHIMYSYLLRNELEDKKYIAKKNFEELNNCRRHIFYKLSSFTYTILGIFSLYYPIKINYFQAFYPFFIIIQGFTSYMNDIIHINTLRWSSLDTSLATYNTLIAILLATYYNLNILQYIILIFGVSFYFLSNYYLKESNIKKYCMYHILWHITIPLLASYVLYTDHIYSSI